LGNTGLTFHEVFEGNMPVGLEMGTEHKCYQLNEAVIFLVIKNEHTG